MYELQWFACCIRCLVRGMQSPQRIRDQRHGKRGCNGRVIRSFVMRHEVRQVLTLQVLHDQTQRIWCGDDVEHGRDVRVIDARRQARLV